MPIHAPDTPVAAGCTNRRSATAARAWVVSAGLSALSVARYVPPACRLIGQAVCQGARSRSSFAHRCRLRGQDGSSLSMAPDRRPLDVVPVFQMVTKRVTRWPWPHPGGAAARKADIRPWQSPLGQSLARRSTSGGGSPPACGPAQRAPSRSPISGRWRQPSPSAPTPARSATA